MQFHLIVTSPFAGHAKGDRITDVDEVEAILASESAGNVVRVPVDGERA